MVSLVTVYSKLLQTSERTEHSHVGGLGYMTRVLCASDASGKCVPWRKGQFVIAQAIRLLVDLSRIR